jgi:hypothetical protein
MEINKEKQYIIDNNKKYDILGSWYIGSEFSILLTKKRFLNIFKNRLNLKEKLDLTQLYLHLRLFIGSGGKISNPIVDISKLYSIYGLHNNQIIGLEETINVIEGYQVMAVLTNQRNIPE